MSYNKAQSVSEHCQVPDNDVYLWKQKSIVATCKLADNSEVPDKTTEGAESETKQIAASFSNKKTEGWRVVTKDLKHPWGISMATDGTMAVAEWGSNSITLIDKEKQRQLLTSTELANPRAVAFTNDSHVLTSDSSKIYKFTREGRVVRTASGSEGFGFSSPAGIATHPYSGLIYVADTDNHRVQVLAPDLTRFGSFGKLGKEQGELFLPWDVAFDSQGNVFIADGNNRIQCFTPQGKFISSFGEGQLHRPSSVAIDESDRIYVTELHSNRVSMFSTTGKCLQRIGCEGEGELNGPCGIVCVGSQLYITDCYNNRVVSVTIDTVT